MGAVPPGHEKGREALRRLRARVCDACHAWPADVTLDDAARGCEAWFCRACSEHELAGIRAPRDDDGGEDEP